MVDEPRIVRLEPFTLSGADHGYVVSESEFAESVRKMCQRIREVCVWVSSVQGPGRSGAIAAVYVSHLLGIPWLPQGTIPPAHLRPHLVVDTATLTGRTLRKLSSKVAADVEVAIYREPPRIYFWYEPRTLGERAKLPEVMSP